MWDRDYAIARVRVAERERLARTEQLLRAAHEGRPGPLQRLLAALRERLAARRALESERIWERALRRADAK